MSDYQFEVPMDVLDASATIHNYGNWLGSKSRPRQHSDKEIIEAIRLISDYNLGAIANPQDVRCEHGDAFGKASWLAPLEFVTPAGCCKARIIDPPKLETN